MRFTHRLFAMEAALSPPPWNSEKLSYDLDGDLADLEIPQVAPYACDTDRNDEVQAAIEASLASGNTGGRLEVVEECGFHGRGPDTFGYFEWALTAECHKDKAWLADQDPDGGAPTENPRHYYPSKHPTPPGMPLHPTNTIRVRLTDAGRAEMDPSELFVWLLYTFNRGYYGRLACGTCQQCIRIRDVKAVPVEGGRTLRNIATFKSGVDPDRLRAGDILLQRIGTREGCGRPYIVVGTDPLETRGHGHRGGRAAGRNRQDFDPRQLERGTLVEMEHTSSRRVAQRIAMDHLVEHADYYIELAKMEAMLRARRRAGNPWVGVNPGPDPEDWNYYINFVIYAVVGLTGQADSLMRKHGPGVRRVAETMRERNRTKLPALYRGLLLEPGLVTKGKCEREMDGGQPVRTFESYSESEDVACWFAHPLSIMSEFVHQQRPSAEGYVAKARGSSGDGRLLWHHTWDTVPIHGREFPLVAAAQAHPEIDPGQFSWNMHTQREAILESMDTPTIKVQPIAAARCPDVDELDATYTYPPFLEQYVRDGKA